MRFSKPSDPTLRPALAWLAIITGAWLLYQPGLSGAFLFDDWSNLAKLGDQGTIDSLNKVVTYLVSGFAGPTGRPIALASFLLDANTWPTAAEPFKQTNILIHLLNGALLSALMLQLARALGAEGARAAWVAVLAAAFWLLHPLMVSTTLYVVQRMAMLAATFVLAGLLTYLHGRALLLRGHHLRGYAWMSFAVVGFGLLATLSKENGALLPLFILVIEKFALNRNGAAVHSAPPGWELWRWLFLYLPLGALLAYMATNLPALFSGEPGIRAFTPWQRLLTETRILVDYLGALWLPHPYTAGLFNDAIVVSKGLFTPVSTGCSILLLTILLGLAIGLRRTAPAVSLAIAFYFTGHVLESTFLQLELYFEHRNYLPAMLMPLPLAWFLVMGTWGRPRTRIAISVAVLCVLTIETGLRAELWGNPFQQALTWARENPTSPRAQNHLASLWLETGNVTEARRLLAHTLSQHPDNLVTRLALLGANCRANTVTASEIRSLGNTLRTTNIKGAVTRYQIDKTLSFLRRGDCPAVTPHIFRETLAAALSNPATARTPRWRQMVLQQSGKLYLEQGSPRAAYRDFLSALHARPRFDGILKDTALLATNEHIELALVLLDKAPQPTEGVNASFGIGMVRSAWLNHTGYYANEMAHLRKLIQQELLQQHQKTLSEVSTIKTRSTPSSIARWAQ